MVAEPTPDPSAADSPPRKPGWRRVLAWVERLLFAGLLIFVAVRLGPQVGALLGVSLDPQEAPSYTLVTLNGDTIRSTDLLGQVVVLNFWATWCGPCRLEMPSLQKLHERRAADGVVVLGLATDVGAESSIRSFIRERDITYPIGRATSRHRRAFGGIPGIPTTFIVDRDGVLRHKVVGYFAPPALNAAVSRLADASAGTASGR
jgi:cytochrome c biogenesis protein CcmG/thiol:disulfide interchange protein DsbE